jgi:enoyl-CoA hydratase/carnithine racemase
MADIAGPALIRTQFDGRVLLLILNRPEKRNALTPSMLAALVEEAVKGLPLCDAVVLCGEGDVFCSGFDMKLVHESEGTLQALLEGLSRAIGSLRALGVPVVVAAHGAAVAGGCALLGAADIVVTDQQAQLGYPVVKLGISPAVSSPTMLSSTEAGVVRARLLDPQLIDGREARRVGLAHICCDIKEDVIPRALREARLLASKPVAAMKATREMLDSLSSTLTPSVRSKALGTSVSLAGSDDQRQRVAALWNKPKAP